MTIKELTDKRLKLAAEIKELRDAYVANEKKWKDAEQEARWKTVNDEYDATVKSIDELRQQESVDARAKQVEEDLARASRDGRNQPIPGLDDRRGNSGGDAGDGFDREGRMAEGPLRGMDREEVRCLGFSGFMRSMAGEAPGSREEAAMRASGINPNARSLTFDLLPTRDSRSIQAEWNRHPHAQRRERVNQWLGRRDEQRALSSFLGSAGGVTVPTTLITALEVNMLAYGGIRAVADRIVTQSGEEMSWPGIDDTGNEGEQVGENQNHNTDADPNFNATRWGAYLFSSKFIKIPETLFEDTAVNLAGIIGELLGERLGRVTSRKFVTGSGAATPYGILNRATLGETAASATAISYADLVELEHSLNPAYRANAGYIFHDEILLALRLLLDSQGRPLWQPSLTEGTADRLNGRPYTIDLNMPSVMAASAKTVLFGDMTRYKIRTVRSIRLKRLVERFAEMDQVGFIAYIREDGNLLDTGTPPVVYLQH